VTGLSGGLQKGELGETGLISTVTIQHKGVSIKTSQQELE